MLNTLTKVNPKNTSQSALLEKFLATWRTRMIRPYTKDRKVLDFGCGEHLWTLRSLVGHAQLLCGFDILYKGLPKQMFGEMPIYGDLSQIDTPVDCVIALACFEHIEPSALPALLDELADRTTADAMIVGTVPRPRAQPVLEFLSYKLGLIDESQIRDHKIYYDESSLSQVVGKSRWRLETYKSFQLGMNSLFTLTKAERTR